MGFDISALPEGVAKRITPTPEGCWKWTGAVTTRGYGVKWWHGVRVNAHRLVYHLLADDSLAISPGRGRGDCDVVDHLCRNRWCVNPEHLEATTQRINATRGGTSALGTGKTSQYVGVDWCPRDQRWTARIRVSRDRRLYLGAFDSETDAAEAYQKALADLSDS